MRTPESALAVLQSVRSSYKLQDTYSKRTAVERVNSGLFAPATLDKRVLPLYDLLYLRGVRDMRLPLIGITMGDPAGVGPELCLRVMREPRVLRLCVPVIFGDVAVLNRVADICGFPSPDRALSVKEWEQKTQAGALGESAVVDCAVLDGLTVQPGKVGKAYGRAAYSYIQAAVTAAVGGTVVGIATGPIHKESLHLAGVPFPGHTEMLASLTGTSRFCMMLASDVIVVSFVTTHIALTDVRRHLTTERITEVITLTSEAMTRLGRLSPKIVVCGLNPHGGEHGLFGTEERDVIEPAVAGARTRGIQVEGPLPPDTAFLDKKRKAVDAYVSMYHDQGSIPFKMLAFDRGVNVTLGLPIVRTSVDHGTAFDIAWQGRASAVSMTESVLWALRLSQRG